MVAAVLALLLHRAVGVDRSFGAAAASVRRSPGARDTNTALSCAAVHFICPANVGPLQSAVSIRSYLPYLLDRKWFRILGSGFLHDR